MRRRAAAVGVAAVVWLATAPIALAQGGDAESDAPDGTSALRQLADARGHHTTLLRDSFQLPGGSGVLFVIGPEIPFKPAEVAEVVRWVDGGGALVYAATTPDPRVEAALGIFRADSSPTFDMAAQAAAATPLLGGVASVRMGPNTPFTSPTDDRVVTLRGSGDGGVAGLEGRLGRGHFFAFASSTILDNQTIGLDDNGRMASDLLESGGGAAPAVFDQYHHAGGAGEGSSLAWLLTPWGLAILLEILLVFGLLAIAGRAFGPRIPLRPAADPSSAEFTSAVGAMLGRAHARRQTIERLLAATRAALAEQVGIRHASDPERLEGALRQRLPALAEALTAATASAAAVNDDRSLARAAAELHRLAHPALDDQRATIASPTRRES